MEERIDALIDEKTGLARDILAGGADILLTEMSDIELGDGGYDRAESRSGMDQQTSTQVNDGPSFYVAWPKTCLKAATMSS